MRYDLFDGQKDGVILLARVLLMVLFVASGWQKLVGFESTIAYVASLGVPFPAFSAAIVVAIELLVGIALVLGAYARPLALLMALYTLATALVGHRYWSMPDAARMDNMIHFYKNVSIVGGLLLLCVTGAGRYSIDRR